MKSRRSLYSIVVEPYDPINLEKQLKKKTSIINNIYGGTPRLDFSIGVGRGVLVVMMSDEDASRLERAKFDWVKSIRRGYYNMNWSSAVKQLQ